MMQMPTIHLELIGEVNVYLALMTKIICAVFMGGLIGIDRERKLKSAGIKTMVLICLGSTLFTAIAYMDKSFHPERIGDQYRIAAQIVSGIGFLGAGAIFQSKGNVIGLTTAALIWFTAAIGVTIGSGYPISAGLFTISVFVILRVIDPIYRLFDLNIYFHLEILGKGVLIGRIEELIGVGKGLLKITEEVIDKKNDTRLLQVYIKTNPKRLKSLINDIHEIIQVKEVHYQILKERPNLD